MEEQKLFREEAIAGRLTASLGSIRIARNIRFEIVALASITMAIALVAFSIWGQVPRKTRVPGILVPRLGLMQVASGVAGSVAEARVAEGTAVKVGEVLFVIDTDRVGAAGATAALVDRHLHERAQALDAERQSRIDNARHVGVSLKSRLTAAEREREMAGVEVRVAEQRVQLFASNLRKYEELGRSGFISESQIERQLQDLNEAEGRFRTAQRTQASIQRDLIGLRADLAAVDISLQTELAQIDRSVAMLRQESVENDVRGRLAVVAPQAGTVTATHVQRGAAVQAGQMLATLVPAGDGAQAEDLEADLYAASRTAGLVHAGQEVWIRFAAFPFEKFGMGQGVVTAVSRTPVNPQDLPVGQAQALLQAAQTAEPMYRVKVSMLQQSMRAFGKTVSLKPGMALDADIVQERRAVWEWLLEPLLAARSATLGR